MRARRGYLRPGNPSRSGGSAVRWHGWRRGAGSKREAQGAGARMKTKAAVLREVGKDWEIIELDLDPPQAEEVLVRYVASGLCHSDDHLRTGDIPVRYPIVGGHEGAGIVEEVGPGFTPLTPGAHTASSLLPPSRPPRSH